jgi:DNA-binding MarR family transcriptional regulator
LAYTYKESLFISFIHTSRAVTKYFDTMLYKKMHLSIVKIAVLTVLDASGGVMTPSEIARVTYTERNNITTLVRRMSKEGLVRIEHNPADKRSLHVVLTDAGRSVFRQARPIPVEVYKYLFASIPGDGLKALNMPMSIIRNNAVQGIRELTSTGRRKKAAIHS